MKIQQAAQNKQWRKMEKQKKTQQQPKYVEHIHEFVSDIFQFSILQININIFILFTCGRRFVIHVKNGRVLDTNWPGSDPRVPRAPASTRTAHNGKPHRDLAGKTQVNVAVVVAVVGYCNRNTNSYFIYVTLRYLCIWYIRVYSYILV